MQYRVGYVRAEQTSQTIRGSWKANTGSVASFTEGEVVNFSPSTAAGRFMSLANGTFRFVVTSGTPADGDVATGASSGATAALTGVVNETKWLTDPAPALAQGDIFIAAGSNIWRAIDTIDADDQITLDAAWSEADGPNLEYTISRDFTSNYGFPIPTPDGIRLATLIGRSIVEIDATLYAVSQGGGVSPEGWNAASIDALWSPVDGYGTPAYRIVNTIMELRGLIKPVSTVDDNDPIFQIPGSQGRRPAANANHQQPGYSLDVNADGWVRYRGVNNWSGYVSLNGILFRGEV